VLPLTAQEIAARADAKGCMLRMEKVRRDGDLDDAEDGSGCRGRPRAVPDEQVGIVDHLVNPLRSTSAVSSPATLSDSLIAQPASHVGGR